MNEIVERRNIVKRVTKKYVLIGIGSLFLLRTLPPLFLGLYYFYFEDYPIRLGGNAVDWLWTGLSLLLSVAIGMFLTHSLSSWVSKKHERTKGNGYRIWLFALGSIIVCLLLPFVSFLLVLLGLCISLILAIFMNHEIRKRLGL